MLVWREFRFQFFQGTANLKFEMAVQDSDQKPGFVKKGLSTKQKLTIMGGIDGFDGDHSPGYLSDWSANGSVSTERNLSNGNSYSLANTFSNSHT